MTKFDPTPADLRIVAALAAREHLLAMFAAQEPHTTRLSIALVFWNSSAAGS